MAKQISRKKRNAQYSFYEVDAPLTSAKISLYGSGVEELDGKVVKLDMSRSLRGKNLELKMKVKNDNGKLVAEPIGAKILSSYIRKVMRKGVDYVEDSFVTDCKDNKVLVKPFLITRNKVSRSVRKALREKAKEFLIGLMTTRNAMELFSDIMSNKLQKEMSLKLKKIYPLALSEIRVFEIVKKK